MTPPDEPVPPPPDAPAPAQTSRAKLWIAAGVVLFVAAMVLLGMKLIKPWHRASGGSAVGSVQSGPGALRAPASPTLVAPAVGGARLSGFVVDGAGLPVAGAEVSAEPEKGAPDRALDRPAPRAPAGAGSGSSSGSATTLPGGSSGSGSGSAAAPPAVVTVAPPTGDNGHFEIAGLAPGRFRVRVTGPGLLPAEVRYVPVPSDEARIVVARQVAIAGTVTDGGAPVANATVGLRGDAIGGTLEAKTDARGAFTFADLPEGRYQLFAYQGALAARAVRVARLGAGPFGPIELRLEAATIVVGRVIDRGEGTGMPAAIELRPSGDDQAPRYARSGDDGVFRIEGVPNGRWIADAFAPGYLSAGGVELEAGKAIPELALARGGAIEGRVVDGDGHPVAGASVRAIGADAPKHVETAATIAVEVSAEVDRDKLRRFSGRTAAPAPVATPGGPSAFAGDPELVARGELGVLVGPIPAIPPPGAVVATPTATATAGTPSAPSAASANPAIAALVGEPPPLPASADRDSIWTTGADGRYRIRGFGKGKVVVLATAAGFAEARSKAVSIEPGQAIGGVDIVLTPGAFLVGKVTDQHGAPVVGAEVQAAPDVGEPLEAFTDDAGEYRIGPVSGTVELTAKAYGHGEARRSVELPVARGQAPAEQREDLVLELADAILAGTLDDATGAPVGGAQLEIVGGVSDGRRATVAHDGTFSIDLLPAGHLRVRVTHPDYPTDEVDVVAQTGAPARVRLRLPLGGAVEGALLDGNSGAPLPSILVTATGPASATAEAATDKLGRWKLGPLKPGHWKLAVKLPGYLPLARDVDVTASRAPGATSVRDVRLDLLRGATLGGTVRDARGNRLGGARVSIHLADGTGAVVTADTDGQGEFRARDCPTGDVVVDASKGDLAGSARQTVRPGDEILGLAIEAR